MKGPPKELVYLKRLQINGKRLLKKSIDRYHDKEFQKRVEKTIRNRKAKKKLYDKMKRQFTIADIRAANERLYKFLKQ